ncbi:MAG: tetratricopeptide repeat protein [Nitrospirales bacterium]
MRFPLQSISFTMRQPGWTLPRFPLYASLLILCAFFSACHHHPQKYPQDNSSTRTQSALVEQQLLTTIQRAETLGPGNPLLLSSLYSLANFYHERKEYEKAGDQYQRALNIKESINGPDHPDLAVILQRYARVLQEANRPTEAANLLARANAILAQSDIGPRSQ